MTQILRPLNVHTRPHSKAEKSTREKGVLSIKATMPTALAPGIQPSPSHDLVFRGGKTIPNLHYANYYVGGPRAWKMNEIKLIDAALAAAMTDKNLNNVMQQYFPGKLVSANFQGSRILGGPPAAVVSQGDIENLVRRMFVAKQFDGLDLTSTILCFMLPRGTILNTDEMPTGGTIPMETKGKKPIVRSAAIPIENDEDSVNGLGGYHGSIHITQRGKRVILYYAVGVYSETRGRFTNGIPVFDQSWKNIVATFYHELQEARTDPDVEDAIRAGDNPNADRFLGWTSAQGEECGDYPVFEVDDLKKVFKEVPLTNGKGSVPIQLQYSNAAHGPEGPIAQVH